MFAIFCTHFSARSLLHCFSIRHSSTQEAVAISSAPIEKNHIIALTNNSIINKDSTTLELIDQVTKNDAKIDINKNLKVDGAFFLNLSLVILFYFLSSS